MLPKWHVILSTIFLVFLSLLFGLDFLQISLIFLSSIFIDFDHYLVYIRKMKNFNLKKAYLWNKNLPKHHKPIMYLFHTIEFLSLVFFLAYFWWGVFFILIGMFFHSVLDIADMIYDDELGCREFSLINYLLSDKRRYLR